MEPSMSLGAIVLWTCLASVAAALFVAGLSPNSFRLGGALAGMTLGSFTAQIAGGDYAVVMLVGFAGGTIVGVAVGWLVSLVKTEIPDPPCCPTCRRS